MAVRKKLGEILVEQGATTAAHVKRGLGHQRQFGGKIGRILVEMQLVSEEQLARALAAQSRMPLAKMKPDIPASVMALIPAELSQKHEAVAFGLRTVDKVETVYVAIADPFNMPGMDELRFRIGKPVKFAVAAADEIARAIGRSQGYEIPLPGDPGQASTLQMPVGAPPAAPSEIQSDPLAGLAPASPAPAEDSFADLFGAPPAAQPAATATPFLGAAPAAAPAGDPFADMFAPAAPPQPAAGDLDALLGIGAAPTPPPAARPSASSALDDLFDVGSSPAQGCPAPSLRAAQAGSPSLMRPAAPVPVAPAAQVLAPAEPASDNPFDLGTPAEALAALSPSEGAGLALDMPDESPLQLETGAEALLSSQYASEQAAADEVLPGEVLTGEELPGEPAELELSDADAVPSLDLTLDEAEQPGALEVEAASAAEHEELPVADLQFDEAQTLPEVGSDPLSGGETGAVADAEEASGHAQRPAEPAAALDVDAHVAGEDLDVNADALFGFGKSEDSATASVPSPMEEQGAAAPTWDLDASAVATEEPAAEAVPVEEAAPSWDLDASAVATEDPAAEAVPAEEAAPTWDLDASAVATEEPAAEVPVEEAASTWDLDASAVATEEPAAEAVPVEEAAPTWDLDASAVATEEPAAEAVPVEGAAPTWDLDVSAVATEEPAAEAVPAEEAAQSWDLDVSAVATEEPAAEAVPVEEAAPTWGLDASAVPTEEPVAEAVPAEGAAPTWDLDVSAVAAEEPVAEGVPAESAAASWDSDASATCSEEPAAEALPSVEPDATAVAFEVPASEADSAGDVEQSWALDGSASSEELAPEVSPSVELEAVAVAFEEPAVEASSLEPADESWSLEASGDAGADGETAGIAVAPEAPPELGVLPESEFALDADDAIAAVESPGESALGVPSDESIDGAASFDTPPVALGPDLTEQSSSVSESFDLTEEREPAAACVSGTPEPSLASDAFDLTGFDNSASGAPADLAEGESDPSTLAGEAAAQPGEPAESDGQEAFDPFSGTSDSLPVAEAAIEQPAPSLEGPEESLAPESSAEPAAPNAFGAPEETAAVEANSWLGEAEASVATEPETDFGALLGDEPVGAAADASVVAAADAPAEVEPSAPQQDVPVDMSWTADAAVDSLGESPQARWPGSEADAPAYRGDDADDEIAIPLANGSVFQPVAPPRPAAPAAPAVVQPQSQVGDPLLPSLVDSLKRIAQGLPASEQMAIPTERLSKAVVKLLLDMGAITSDDLLEMLAISPEKLSAATVKVLLGRGFIGADDLVAMLAIPVDRLNATVLVMMLERGVFDAARVLKALR